MSAQPTTQLEQVTQSPVVQEQQVFTVKEAAAYTRLSRTTLWKAIDEGRLSCFRVGRRVLFARRHLDEFLNSFEQK